jgi:superfamily I DNA/RNA helicase
MKKLQLPIYTKLTLEQQQILDEIQSVGVYGGAGTGKTIISIYRHIYNWDKNGVKSFLITFTHTLTHFFENVLPEQNLEASKYVDNIDGFLKRLDKGEFVEIEEIIIDEAQDVSVEVLERLKKSFKVSYGADDNQILYPYKSSKKEDLENLFNENISFNLSENFRNSFQILQFVDEVFPNRISKIMMDYSEENYSANREKPNIIYSTNSKKLEDYLLELIDEIPNNKTVAVLVPTKELILFYREFFDKHELKYSSYYYEDNKKEESKIRNNGIERIHLTPFKSSKGLEFDVVIMPNFQEFLFWRTEHKYPVKKNDYYVGMTRAKENLFLLTEDISMLQNVNSETYILENI